MSDPKEVRISPPGLQRHCVCCHKKFRPHPRLGERQKILVTLTWDTNGTDLDTYVIDPTGDYSCYYHKVTADGGALDHDVTTGYGPEHWTLTDNNTVRYGQPYKIRVHYYSDHGHGGTNYTVSIVEYEGTTRQQTQTYRGYLGVSIPSNNQPNGTVLAGGWSTQRYCLGYDL